MEPRARSVGRSPEDELEDLRHENLSLKRANLSQGDKVRQLGVQMGRIRQGLQQQAVPRDAPPVAQARAKQELSKDDTIANLQIQLSQREATADRLQRDLQLARLTGGSSQNGRPNSAARPNGAVRPRSAARPSSAGRIGARQGQLRRPTARRTLPQRTIPPPRARRPTADRASQLASAVAAVAGKLNGGGAGTAGANIDGEMEGAVEEELAAAQQAKRFSSCRVPALFFVSRVLFPAFCFPLFVSRFPLYMATLSPFFLFSHSMM